MKTKQNTTAKTAMITSLIFGLCAATSYAKPNQSSQRNSHQAPQQHRAPVVKHHNHQHTGYINRLPSNRATVRLGNILYYIVGNTFYTQNHRGYKAVAKPRGYQPRTSHAPKKTKRYSNRYQSKGRR